MDDKTLGHFPLVPAGTALVTDAERVSCVGFASYATCSTSQFIARDDGTFPTQGDASSSSSSGDVTAIGADQRGTCTVEAPGRLHLRYVDGHEDVRAVQLFRDGDTGATDPASRGLIIDGGLYTP